jgi:hypothetical protein
VQVSAELRLTSPERKEVFYNRMNSMLTVSGRAVRVQGRLIRQARLDADKYLFLDDPKPMLEGLRKSGVRIDIFTFLQRLPETSPKYDYPMEWDNLAAIPISTFDHWWNEQIGFKARNKAKQSEKKGVVVREVPFDDALVKGIWEIYNECPLRQGKPFRHYGKDVETVGREAATYLDNSIFIGAFLGPQLIAFAKLTFDEASVQANLMHIVSMIQYRDKSATNALIVQAVRSCAQRKISYLVYTNFAYGKKEKDSLSDFKERNGFERIDLPRYYVPLTLAGSAALRLGLHHRIFDYVPESVAARLRELRRNWYQYKFQPTLKGASE